MDWVEIGAYLTVILSIVVIAVLSYRVYNLIWKDSDKK